MPFIHSTPQSSSMAAPKTPFVAPPPGSVPAHLGSPELQVERALARLRSIQAPLEKYAFLSDLRERSEPIFYALVGSNMRECMPLIYTPVIGAACQNWSELTPPPAPVVSDEVKALYLSANDKDRLPEIIQNLKTRLPHDKMEICVVTDGSRILGLGDLGVGGMGISQGKLSLYTAAGGVDPRATLPIVLDLGTDNESLLANPLYVGLRRRRLSDAESEAFADIFMAEMHKTFPNMVIQFEDWRTSLAFPLLHKNRDVYPCFNDDIQGTGAVILAGAIRAFKLNGKALKDQRIVFFGAGSSGVGVAETIQRHFELQGISAHDARKMFYLVDSKGLVARNRGDKLAEHKLSLARDEDDAPRLKTLEEVVRHVKPTALMGLSTVGGAFTSSVLEYMASINQKPIVFALSNPVTQAECTFEEAVKASDGRVLFASGSPFDDVVYKDKTYQAAQGNNLYIFPALGLGSIMCGATRIPEELVHAAAEALAGALTPDELDRQLLYPDLDRIREVSVTIAQGVIRAAQRLDVDKRHELRGLTDAQLEHAIRSSMYHPLVMLDDEQEQQADKAAGKLKGDKAAIAAHPELASKI